eukprot:TRINITY_DN19292_c0_g1_i1.p1 TRINITY_DN19292_c0_g1~~TRINITY_DN19292_c0_g1_i1.p1  ORF type:complete len:168 (+),score=52.02 TRINITY_DN19292_c0_g1_i1:55-558(+)
MIIFMDKISGDEIFSDAQPYKIVDDVLYEIECKKITIGPAHVDIGANESAEEGTEQLDDSARVAINVVESHQLNATSLDKKQYMAAIKTYMKALKAKLEAEGSDRAEAFTKGATEAVKKILANFDDYEFYVGASYDMDAMMPLIFYKGENPNPFMYVWRDGVRGQKV